MEQPKNLLNFDGVSAIAFNKDFTMCVASHRDKNLYIYKVNGINESSKWELKYTLKSVSIFLIMIILIVVTSISCTSQELTGMLTPI